MILATVGRLAMHTQAYTLSSSNIDTTIERYTSSIASLSARASALTGLALLSTLGRTPVGAGPYPCLTLLEAASRIMSDLVILHGVRSLLAHSAFPFDCYRVELGRERTNGFDVSASNSSGARLVGQAEAVPPASFRLRKRTLLRRLWRSAASVDFRILLVNYDAIAEGRLRALPAHHWLLGVDIDDGTASVIRG
jgi:hypothetical protein